jgi:hypothetical protein
MKTRLYDTFNRCTVSNHRSLRAAVLAERKFSRAVKRTNGPNSYIPTRIEYLTDDLQWIGVPSDEVMDVKHQLDTNFCR